MGPPRHYRHRTLEERLKIHAEVATLRGSGMTVKEVADALGISRRDVSYWTRMNKPSRTVYNPDLTPRPELAYLVGAYLGDGRTAGPKDKKVRFNLADQEFADQLNELVAKVIGARLKTVPVEEGFHSVSYDCAVLYDFLQQPLSAQIPLAESFPAEFLRGFFDAEGYASQTIWPGSNALTAICVGAANCNLDYLDLARRLLATLGIPSEIRMTNKAGQPMEIRGRTYIRKRNVFHVRINEADYVEKFRDRVGFSVPEKKQKLADLVAIVSIPDEWDRYDRFTDLYEKKKRKWMRRGDASSSNHSSASAENNSAR